MPDKKSTNTELQGIINLIADATIGITDLVEAMHKQVVHPPFIPSTPIQNLITKISGIAYKNIKWSTQFISNILGKSLVQLGSVLGQMEQTEKKEAIRSILNGVIGDHLEKTENPLIIPMRFRHQSNAISLDSESIKKAYPAINGKILLMIHGSCMNDIQWTKNNHNHGLKLAEELQKTPIFLHYNSGRHISTNGKELSELLDELLRNWPVPAEELVILAHSMGGLVIRSAFYYGQKQNKLWTKHLKKIIFLGTPHHGAPLEQAGNYIDVVLEAIPYAKPFARLGKIRSAGVTDLRFGNIIDEDWENKDRFEMQGDQRLHIPLPIKIECYGIAGTTGKEKESLTSKLLGDKMVGIDSALGHHKKPNKALKFKKNNTFIAFECNHTELLSNLDVYNKIREWMGKI